MIATASLSDLINRVEKLEHAVFGGGKKSKSASGAPGAHSGATGGIRLLIEEGFFDQRCNFAKISAELEKRGYHYSRQAIQMPLTRLSKISGPLVSLTVKGRNVYAKRK